MGKQAEKLLKIIGYFVIIFFLMTGLAQATLQLKPFWLDEWFIIHNLKFKDAGMLWGQLDYMQQFPRAYLSIIKAISAAFNYSYSSLRIPSYIVHSTAVLFCLMLGKRLFGNNTLLVFVWVLIYISFKTSIDYYVQVKQYTMEMLLGVAAIWQVVAVHQISVGKKLKSIHWFLLMLGVVGVPFLSYTYPILAAALFVVAILRAWLVGRDIPYVNKLGLIAVVAVGAAAIVMFYLVDVRHVMHDEGMQDYWKDFIMKDGFNVKLFFSNIYKLFAHLGAGGLFEIIFGVLGLGGWLLGLINFGKNIRSKELLDTLVAYATVLVALMIILFAAGKLPLGAHRLNAFATPLLALLNIHFLLWLQRLPKARMPVMVTMYVLFLALAGNIVSSVINSMTSVESKKKYAIYHTVTDGLQEASATALPIIVNRDITYPHDVHEEVTGDWVIETYPAYDIRQKLPVYPVNSHEEAAEVMKAKGFHSAMYISASSYEQL